MAKQQNNARLGRGLDALISMDSQAAAGSTNLNEIELSKIRPNPNQPRRDFDQTALEELAESIRVNGVITPVTLRGEADGTYLIIAGERRWRASQMAGLDRIPAYVRDASEGKVQELALIENIQREDLNAIEIALSYSSLMQTNSYTQETLAERVGKKRATVANYLRLLKLPAEIQMALKEGRIEMGHARALAGVDSPARQLAVFEQIVAEEASVRRAEELARTSAEEASGAPSAHKARQRKSNTSSIFQEDDIANLAAQLCKTMNASVKVAYNDKGRGRITIPFASDEELMSLMSLFDKLEPNAE